MSILAQAIAAELVRSGRIVYFRSSFDVVRDLMHDKAFDGYHRVIA